jgi:hypothetical protein
MTKNSSLTEMFSEVFTPTLFEAVKPAVSLEG